MLKTQQTWFLAEPYLSKLRFWWNLKNVWEVYRNIVYRMCYGGKLKTHLWNSSFEVQHWLSEAGSKVDMTFETILEYAWVIPDWCPCKIIWFKRNINDNCHTSINIQELNRKLVSHQDYSKECILVMCVCVCDSPSQPLQITAHTCKLAWTA